MITSKVGTGAVWDWGWGVEVLLLLDAPKWSMFQWRADMGSWHGCVAASPLDPTLLTAQALHSPDRAVCQSWSHGPTSDLANRCWKTRNPAGSVSGSVLCGWWFWKGSAGVESLALGSPGRLFQTAGLHHHGQDTWMEALLSSLWCWAEVWMAMSPGRNDLSQMSHFQVLFFHPPARLASKKFRVSGLSL